ncbi:cellulase [Wilcoxina mikolae CBS 423.85]|nr:cellulase [Wilcoxina mikolae CBS 423.85]
MMCPIIILLSLALSVASLVSATPASKCNADNPFLNRLNAARTRTVQGISTFLWLADFAAVKSLKKYLDEAIRQQRSPPHKKLVFPFVVYNLPDRDCAAKASDGELHLADDGEKKYREYVDLIYVTITADPYDCLDYAVVVEPDNLGNSITNLNKTKCVRAALAYARGVAYAIEKLGTLSNVALYLDAAHSNWLGWPKNLEPTAKLMKKVLDIANHNQTYPSNPAKIRSFSTNVSNYNGYNPTTPDKMYGPGPDNPNWSELRYAKALMPYLQAEGLPIHFIIDQVAGRALGNIKGAGFGIRPTTHTGECIIDAIVWVKPGGESDGTSNNSSARFDENCRSSDTNQPATEAGAWFEDFVEMLVKNANPPLKLTWKY